MAVPFEVVADNYSQDFHLSDELKFFVVNGQLEDSNGFLPLRIVSSFLYTYLHSV